MSNLFLCYKKCSTCAKAKKFLEENEIDYTYREIYVDNPNVKELTEWIEKSGLPLKRFFNTSGIVYREKNLKDKLPNLTDKEAIELLSTDGRLVKRPLLVTKDSVLVGFREEEYRKVFKL